MVSKKELTIGMPDDNLYDKYLYDKYYFWTREPVSLATGAVIDGSDQKLVLILTDIVTGRYVFKLTVYDGQGLSASDTVNIIVRPDALLMNLGEVT
ncbi:dyslexia-associated protein KIAA0319-like [Anopheles ziemanni]|uniref:dyslexia-associated protein KIAA0319-like n=1 Tax=Anopheles ziemanni TaxID=345580 RepID=UPI00265E6AF1|nr:dyslexia-associated protein KIAA0319-like [Anopheles ziemanni]